MLPVIKLGGTDITRLIIGGNPFSGNSHVSAALDAEMMDYFTTENIKKTLWDCVTHGINAMQLRGDRHIMRIMRELQNEGCPLRWIAQTTPETAPFDNHVQSMLAYDPAAIYHHGTVTDALFKDKQYDELARRMSVIRKTGKPSGLGTHMPEVITYAEEHRWEVDFYMACVHNLSVETRESSAVTNRSNTDERFEDEDRPLMYAAIRGVDKPCLAFKILGATRKCQSRESVEAAFRDGSANIKKTDAIVVGMYPKLHDQVRENCGIVEKILA
jgi:hypothetical protein